VRKVLIGFCVAILLTGVTISYVVSQFTVCDPLDNMIRPSSYFQCVMERR